LAAARLGESGLSTVGFPTSSKRPQAADNTHYQR